MSRRSRTLDAYVAAVTAAGLALLVGFARTQGLGAAAQGRGFWLFATLLFLGEVFPISVPRRGGEVDEVTASTTFAFALLIGFGTPAAVLTQVLASVVADLILRKAPWKIAFNAGQYTLSLGIAGLLYHGLGGGMHPTGASLWPFLLAGLVFFSLNTAITDVAVALSTNLRLVPYLSKDLLFQAQATLPLLALAPVIVAAMDESLWLVPLATAPTMAVWWGTRLALENARLASRLQASLARQQELNRMKDDFVAVVSHELRTPLTSIQGYIKTLLQLPPELAEAERTSFLSAADRQGDRLRRLIEQLLVVGRLESQVDALGLTAVRMDRLTSAVVDELRSRAQGHEFDVRIAADLPEVRTDEAKLHQILSNLVENALKYAPAGTRVTVQADRAAGGVEVRVRDEGIGIPEDAHARIFDRFYQVDQSATRTVGGTGLGLYICRRLAEAIGARLWLARSDEGGSEFALLVPWDPPRAQEPDERGDAIDDQSITASV